MTTHPSVIFCAMPRSVPRFPLYVVVGAPFGIAAVAIAVIVGGGNVGTGVGVGGILFGLYLLILVSGLFAFARRRQPVDNLAHDARSAHGRALIALDHDTPFLVQGTGHMLAWPRLRAYCEAEGVAPPHTVVRRELEEIMQAVDTPAHLLEPEPILPSSSLSPKMIALLLFIYIFNAVIAVIAGNAGMAVIWLVVGAAWVISTPTLRDRLRILRGSDGKIIAGQGWIRDRRGRTWRAGDATMILTSPSGNPPMHAVITGPAGTVALTFMHERDPDFIALWQRWNHPDPRPELADS